MNAPSQPLVSVVTPVYNGERFLAECVDSVLTQTYKNWEYVITNNCSTDRTLEIAQRYARDDVRVRVHNNERFVSAVENHHVAFREISARSKYCKVVHADDWLFPECLTRMVQVAEANPSVGIVGAYRLKGASVTLDGLPYPSTVVSGREICLSNLRGHLHVFGSPTSVLIRSEIIRDRPRFYDEVNFPRHSDTAVCYEVLRHWDFGFVHQVLTYTRRHGEAGTALYRDLNTPLAEKLMMLMKYGPVYLDQATYQASLGYRKRRYFVFLGTSLFRKRNRQFWAYHGHMMKVLGYPFSTLMQLRVSLLAIVDKSLYPVKPLLRTIRAFRKDKLSQAVAER